jgi:hypothetical protein
MEDNRPEKRSRYDSEEEMENKKPKHNKKSRDEDDSRNKKSHKITYNSDEEKQQEEEIHEDTIHKKSKNKKQKLNKTPVYDDDEEEMQEKKSDDEDDEEEATQKITEDNIPLPSLEELKKIHVPSDRMPIKKPLLEEWRKFEVEPNIDFSIKNNDRPTKVSVSITKYWNDTVNKDNRVLKGKKWVKTENFIPMAIALKDPKECKSERYLNVLKLRQIDIDEKNKIYNAWVKLHPLRDAQITAQETEKRNNSREYNAEVKKIKTAIYIAHQRKLRRQNALITYKPKTLYTKAGIDAQTIARELRSDIEELDSEYLSRKSAIFNNHSKRFRNCR